MADLEASGDEIVKRDRVSEFFRNKVAKFVQVPLHRLVFGVIFATWMGVAIWQALQLEPTKENEQFLNEDHPLQKSITILNEQFPTANDDIGLKIYMAWGLEEVSRDGVNRLLDPEYFGKPNFVESFEFNEQCQTELMVLCDDLKANPDYRELIKRRDGLGAVYCFIEELGLLSPILNQFTFKSRQTFHRPPIHYSSDELLDFINQGLVATQDDDVVDEVDLKVKATCRFVFSAITITHSLSFIIRLIFFISHWTGKKCHLCTFTQCVEHYR